MRLAELRHHKRDPKAELKDAEQQLELVLQRSLRMGSLAVGPKITSWGWQNHRYGFVYFKMFSGCSQGYRAFDLQPNLVAIFSFRQSLSLDCTDDLGCSLMERCTCNLSLVFCNKPFWARQTLPLVKPLGFDGSPHFCLQIGEACTSTFLVFAHVDKQSLFQLNL